MPRRRRRASCFRVGVSIGIFDNPTPADTESETLAPTDAIVLHNRLLRLSENEDVFRAP